MKTVMSLLLICFAAHVIAQMPTCDSIVYPGDFNRDGVVSVHDVLYWGVVYGETGAMRPDATLEWIPQASEDWAGIINDVNYNNQDANGDGIVDTLDLDAIYENYDSMHTCIIKNQIITMVNGLHIDYNVQFNADNMVKIHNYYIDVKNYSFHGLAFTFDYSGFGNAFMQIEVDAEGAWLEPDAVVMVDDAINGQLHVAVTRTDQMDVANDGSYALVIIICEDVAALTDQTKIYMNDIEGIKADQTRFLIADDSLTTPTNEPECRVIYDGEQSDNENCLEDGEHNDKEAHRGDYCFEGFNLDTWNESIMAFWCDDPHYYNLSYYDSLAFYIKADQPDKTLMLSLFPFFSDNYVPLNINDYIESENLTTTYQRVSIPLDDFIMDDCDDFTCMLGRIDKLVFHSDDEAFNFYVDDVIVTRGEVFDACNIIDNVTGTDTNVHQLITYPNPTFNTLNIDVTFDKYTQAHLQIMDVQGKVVDSIQADFSAGTQTFQYSSTHLLSGVYIIHIRDENGVLSYGKFMKM